MKFRVCETPPGSVRPAMIVAQFSKDGPVWPSGPRRVCAVAVSQLSEVERQDLALAVVDGTDWVCPPHALLEWIEEG